VIKTAEMINREIEEEKEALKKPEIHYINTAPENRIIE